MPNHNLLYQDVLLVECLEAIRTLPAHLYTQQISQVIAKIEDHLSLAIPVTTFNRFAKKYYSPFNRKKFNKISRVVNVTTQEYPKPKFKVHRPCRPQDIQPDVLKYICKIIHGKNRNNNKDLLNFGLTCKNWCKAALKQLYYSPNFDSIEKLSNLSVSISYIDVKPRYVNYIQELHLPRVPESKNTILYRKHVESIAAGGNIVCLTAPSIKIDFLNRILFYCPNIERLSVDSVILLDEESDNVVEIQMLAQQCECLMDVRFEFVESPKFIYEDSTDGGTDISQLQNEEYPPFPSPGPHGNYSNISSSNDNNDNNNIMIQQKRWSSVDNYMSKGKKIPKDRMSSVDNYNNNKYKNNNTIKRLSMSSSTISSSSLSNSPTIPSNNNKKPSLLPKPKLSVNTSNPSSQLSISTTLSPTSTEPPISIPLNNKGSSIPVPIGNSTLLSSSPPSKGFSGSSRFSGVSNRKSFDNSNVFMDRPASALSLSNYQNHHTSTGSFDIPSGGVSNIASFFERPSSALSNASNTTSNSTSDLKRIIQMEDVVLNGLGRKLEVLTKRHLSLSAMNGLIKHCPQLKKIRLIDPMDCLPSLPKFENLQTIDITTSRKSHIKQFSHIFNSRTFTRLEHIKIEYDPPSNRPIQRLDQLLFHFSMSAILSHCPRLKSLIHPIYPSTQDEFLNLLKTMRSLPDLKALSLRNYVNDRLLTTISQKFPSLEALDISNTCYVTGYGIVDVVVNCVKLRYFGIHGIPIVADDIQEIQRRLPRCRIFSQFDPKWIWSEKMYYLCDTVIYKDDEWKKNDNYEEELLDEDRIKEEDEEEEVESPSEITSSGPISEVAESLTEDEPNATTESLPESSSEPVLEEEEESISTNTTPTLPSVVITDTLNHDVGMIVNEDEPEEEEENMVDPDEPSPSVDSEEGQSTVDSIVESTPTLNHEVLSKSEEEEEEVIDTPNFEETIKNPSFITEDDFLEDNDELTIKGSSLNNSFNSPDRSQEEEGVAATEDEQASSVDEPSIRDDDYSQSQTFYEHQEEIIQDPSITPDTSINLLNLDDEEVEQPNQPSSDEEAESLTSKDEDLRIKEDIRGLLENTIFMDEDQDQDQDSSKKLISEKDSLGELRSTSPETLKKTSE